MAVAAAKAGADEADPAGADETVEFALTARDLATYDAGRWRQAVGEFGAVVGASSRDHRLEASFSV